MTHPVSYSLLSVPFPLLRFFPSVPFRSAGISPRRPPVAAPHHPVGFAATPPRRGIGYGFSASGGYSQSRVDADYASVIEPSGIFAGDDGYQITVGGHTHLQGGLITSTQRAEDEGKNRFCSRLVDTEP